MTITRDHRLKAVFITVLILLLAIGTATAVAAPGRMYVTGARSVVQLRLLTGDKLAKGSITFDAKCSSGDLTVRIRRGRVSHRQTGGGYGVKITGTVGRKAFTGTITSWGPGCSLSRDFTARRQS